MYEEDLTSTDALIVTIEAFDWNCPQYITPRYTEAELVEMLAPFRARLDALEEENAVLRKARDGA